MREGWGSVWWRNFRLLFYDQPVPGHLSTNKLRPLQLSTGQPTVTSVEWLPFMFNISLTKHKPIFYTSSNISINKMMFVGGSSSVSHHCGSMNFNCFEYLPIYKNNYSACIQKLLPPSTINHQPVHHSKPIHPSTSRSVKKSRLLK